MLERDCSDDGVQRQVYAYETNRDVDCFLEALQEDCAEDCEQQERNPDLALHPPRGKWIVHEVCGRVSRRQGHGDHEVGCGETEQHENKDFPTPPGKELLQHGNAALSVRAGLGHTLVNW